MENARRRQSEAEVKAALELFTESPRRYDTDHAAKANKRFAAANTERTTQHFIPLVVIASYYSCATDDEVTVNILS